MSFVRAREAIERATMRCLVVVDDAVLGDLEPELGEAGGKPRGVGVDELSACELRADTEDGACHGTDQRTSTPGEEADPSGRSARWLVAPPQGRS